VGVGETGELFYEVAKMAAGIRHMLTSLNVQQSARNVYIIKYQAPYRRPWRSALPLPSRGFTAYACHPQSPTALFCRVRGIEERSLKAVDLGTVAALHLWFGE